jgi:TRAP-type transport system periplasmic protein
MNIFRAAAVLGFCIFCSPLAAQKTTIKLATLAPDGSNWINAVRAIDADIRQATDDAVSFKIYPGGVQGDEDVMLRKIRVGQLHAGGFAGRGLSQILPDILATEMPFLFENYREVDYVAGKMTPYYREALLKAGYVLLGWVDVGFVHLMSQNPVRSVDDIKKTKVWRIESDPLTAALFKRAGVNSVPLAIPDVLLGLQTNLVEVVYAPPSAAIVLQWFTRVKYLTELPVNYTNGALLLAKKTFDRLSPQHQEALLEISAIHLKQQNQINRSDNIAALDVMRDQGLQFIKPDSVAIGSFKDLVEQSKTDLVGKAFSQQAYDMVLGHLGDYRRLEAEAQE